MTKAQRLVERIRAHNRERAIAAHRMLNPPLIFGEPATIVRDSFNRPNAASLGNAETGQAYVDYGGALQIISGQCAWTSSGADVAQRLVDSGSSDGRIRVSMMSNTQFVEFIFRGVDVNNWLLFGLVVAGANQDVEIWQKVANVYTRIGQEAVDLTAGQYYTFECVYQGSSISLYRNGALSISITETDNQNGTLIGPRMRAANERIDWYEVYTR